MVGVDSLEVAIIGSYTELMTEHNLNKIGLFGEIFEKGISYVK